MRFLIMLALLALPAMADELVMKDGKVVSWSNLKDLGDTFEVETTDGIKLEVKKTDVARIDFKTRAAVKKEEASTALTGATFTWEKGRKLTQFDLLKSIDLKKDAKGIWKATGTSISGRPTPNEGWALLEPSYIPPAEYDLSITIERAEAGNGFILGLVGEGQNQMSFGLDFDGWTGAWLIDGKGAPESGVGIKDLPFQKIGQKRTVTFMVRKIGLLVKLDGKDYLSWRGSWSKVAPHPTWKSDKKNVISFTFYPEFKIHQAMVTFPKE